jgi:LysR family transcriptional regulator, transcription activator of glutamate synthase operon
LSMEINQLKEFVVLAQTGNFLEAAEKLYSSQSTLSKHIKNIESELGVPLFDRTTRKVGISKFGQLMLPYALQIIELQDKYTTTLRSSLETDKEIFTLGSIPALAEYHITDVLVSFKKTRSQSTINVIQERSEDLRDMLRQKKCELAFIRFFGKVDDDLIGIPYANDTMVAAFPITHSLAKQKTIPLKILANENLLLLDKNTMLYRISIDACQQVGFEPKIAYEDHRLENIVELILKGMGVALLMKPLALYLGNPQIAIVDITPIVATEVRLCYLKNVELSNAAKHFIQCAKLQAKLWPSEKKEDLVK